MVSGVAVVLLVGCAKTTDTVWYRFPAWTPDGKIVYFKVTLSFTSGDFTSLATGQSRLSRVTSELRRMNPDGSGDTKLFDYEDSHISVSRDGTKYWIRDAVVDSSGSILLQNKAVTGDGDWNPDGTEIVFSDTETGKIKIWNLSNNQVDDLNLYGRTPVWKYNEYFIFSSYINNKRQLVQFFPDRQTINTNIEGDVGGASNTPNIVLVRSFRESIGYEIWDFQSNLLLSQMPYIGTTPYGKTSPNCVHIVWSEDNNIYIENLDGTDRKKLR